MKIIIISFFVLLVLGFLFVRLALHLLVRRVNSVLASLFGAAPRSGADPHRRQTGDRHSRSGAGGVVDTKAAERAGRKIFAADEGEYVDFKDHD